MVTIPPKISERFIKEIGKFQKRLKEEKNRNIKEANTVTTVMDMLSDVFCFNRQEVTREYEISKKYCDLAVKVDGKIKFLIEVKAMGKNLNTTHLNQVVNYGTKEKIQWVVLTNGIHWQIYKIKESLNFDLVCSFDFTELNLKKPEDQKKLFLLCREGIKKKAIEEYYKHKQIINRFNVGAIICSEYSPVLSEIRKTLTKIYPDVKTSTQKEIENEIKEILRTEVLKLDVVEGAPAEDALKSVRRKLKKQAAKK